MGGSRYSGRYDRDRDRDRDRGWSRDYSRRDRDRSRERSPPESLYSNSYRSRDDYRRSNGRDGDGDGRNRSQAHGYSRRQRSPLPQAPRPVNAPNDKGRNQSTVDSSPQSQTREKSVEEVCLFYYGLKFCSDELRQQPVYLYLQQTEKEKKLRERQERLRLWKEKQEREARERSSTVEPDSKQVTPGGKVDTKPLTLAFGNAPKRAATSKLSVGSLFGGGEDDMPNEPPLKRPFAPANGIMASQGGEKIKQGRDKSLEKHGENEKDPLDEFMTELTTKTGINSYRDSVVARSGLAEVIMDEDGEEIVAAEDGDEPDVKPEEYLALLEQKKKKEIAQVDHSKIDYEPFRKQFYVEPPELSSLSKEEVENLRVELDGIKVRGVNVPNPVIKWTQFGLQAQVMEVIRSLGYDKPTAIQAQSIPAIMSGRDVIGVAKTGSGKTMAFLLPMFRQIKDQRPLANLEGPMGLIMTPTRELAVQIFRECKPFVRALGLRAVCAYGGSPIKDQIADLKRGAEIIVCTPGRMIDLLAANGGRVTNLQRVTYLVLDEADRMFDMGFEPQVMRIVNNARPDRQTVLFSATFPRQMEALAKKILHKPVEIIVGARSVVAPEITQIVEVRKEETKFRRVLELLGRLLYDHLSDSAEGPRALVFVERQEAADELLKELMSRGYPCFSIHGGKDQADRDSAINDFKNGVVKVLIATSVAARGLDVKQLKLVINYDPPSHMEDYVHRVGRTGRAGQTGTAVTFITPDQGRAAMDVTRALKLSKQEVPEDVQKLADEFIARVKEGKERYGSGFGGKGLERLDEARTTARKRERKAYNVDEPDKDEDGSDDDEMASTAAPTAGSTPAPSGGAAPVSSTDQLKEMPIVQRGFHDVSAAGKIRAGAAPENRGPDVGQFHTTIEINDLPQEARRAATQRGSHSKVIESFSVSITQKGTYYPPGRQPGKGDEPKLYLLIEGPTEAQVSGAYRTLVNMVLGGIEQAASDTKGRYSV